MLESWREKRRGAYKILNQLQSYKVENAFLVGPVFQKVSSESGFKSFHNVALLMEFLKSENVKGNAILIKGSRGIGLEKVYDLL